MITCNGAGASYALVKELDQLASRHGCQVTWAEEIITAWQRVQTITHPT